MSRDYGVLIEEEGVAQRALFIIDPKGIVRSITINDADVGRSVNETLRVLDALTFKDEYGQGCPVDWKKGEAGIDITSKSHIEGSVELKKKSWGDWARPKLDRAWSAASQKSITSNNLAFVGSRLRASSNDKLSPVHNGERSGQHSSMSSGRESPMYSPTSNGMQGQMDKALLQQRFENMQAALTNQSMNQSQGIGMAN